MEDRTRICSECPGTFELIPPADADYTVPITRKPTTDDYMTRKYECNGKKRHENVVHWVEGGFVGGSLRDPPHDDFGTQY